MMQSSGMVSLKQAMAHIPSFQLRKAKSVEESVHGSTMAVLMMKCLDISQRQNELIRHRFTGSIETHPARAMGARHDEIQR